MACYVDELMATKKRVGWGYKKSCHLLCDTPEELREMGRKLGLEMRWIQKPGTPAEHFDLVERKRTTAILFGAIGISRRELAMKIRDKRNAAIPRQAG